MKRRHSFMLMETLIASSLAIMVIGICVSLFVVLQKTVWSQGAAVQHESQQSRKSATLRWILSRIHRGTKDPFYLEDSKGGNSRLIFVFDHGVHINPQLSNEDLAELYIDQTRGLVLVTRSHPQRGVIGQDQEESSVIWPGAKSLTWRFALREKDRKERRVSSRTEESEWSLSWPPEWTGLPVVIEARIDDESGPSTVTAIVSEDIGSVTAR